ncbi:unnamed protein product [Cladocopium goreaui]|uniref:D-3-phosphoglycerate dehydrogenase (PGDH) n=1 Tax=Cladocopium goreaui TaxID=2562237 RepID=A0A9P1FFN9_9DINO|nr:unnamed protein product [Cladocopium goreaui]
MPRVLVTPAMLHEKGGPFRDILEAAGLEVVFPTGGLALMDPVTLQSNLEGIDAVLAGMEPFNRDVLSTTKLRAIARMGVGYDAIDVPAATDCGVPVTITPGTNEPSVAEQTLALIFGVMRGLPERAREVRSGHWLRQTLPRLEGKTLGLVGLGRIGKALVPKAHGLGLKVIAYDPFVAPELAVELGVRLCSLDELLEEADIVSLHCPLNAETRNLIDADAMAKMKVGSVLINAARGGIVDEGALADALRRGHLMGAGLDVFETEPLPLESPLLGLDNIVLTPHMGGLDHESQVAMSSLAAECIAKLYQGQWPEGCVVNDELREGWKW